MKRDHKIHTFSATTGTQVCLLGKREKCKTMATYINILWTGKVCKFGRKRFEKQKENKYVDK